MPMNEEVRKAVKAADDAAKLAANDSEGIAQWNLIRAELTRLTKIADSVDPLVVRLGEVTARLEAAEKDAQLLRSHRPIARKLEAANALLRDIHDAGYYRMKIDAHLSEPRT